jgi:hypothetical protein
MKTWIAAALLLMIGCKGTESKQNVSMPGAYKLLTQSFKGDKTDTSLTTLLGLKIYTDDFMMYGNMNPADSTASFGVGSYSVDKDTVAENLIFNASSTYKSETPETFKLGIEKSETGYKQIISNMQMGDGEKITLREEYNSIGKATKSPLDGVWKLTRAYWTKGKDSSENKVIQYKTYFAGYVLWGHYWADSANKSYAGLGIGTFTMTGNNKVKESMTASTYYQVRGSDFDLDIEMNGADGFTQTMRNADSSKSVEIYQRLKK